MTTTITPHQRLTVVKHLAQGKNPTVVATITKIPREEIVDIGSHHGYPKLDSLARAAELLAKKIDDDAAADAISTSPTSPSGARLVEPARPAAPTRAPAPAAAPAKPDEFRALINTAKGIDSKKIQGLANRILDDVAKLRGLVDDHQAQAEAERQAAAEREKAQAEVDRLEAQLAQARARLGTRGRAATSTSSRLGASPKEVRTWAAANGHDVPSRGRVPADIVDAYQKAHPGGDAA